jgi:dephospho-CoA kinase
MLKIGITGGIGSGKSIVAKVFEHLDIPVYNADTAAKSLMEKDPALRASITELFGPEAYLNGTLNRSLISSLVFKDSRLLEALNALVHPATIQYGNEWMNRQSAPYVIKEAALIFESGTQAELDYVIGVYAPQALRIHRVMQRDTVTREQVMQRMANQLDESLKMKLCDVVVVNDDQQLVLPQVLALHEKFLKG